MNNKVIEINQKLKKKKKLTWFGIRFQDLSTKLNSVRCISRLATNERAKKLIG